ncbi:MAG: ADP-ribosylglycohydrolase family protein, partial [Verrucomicrobiota bacterium]
ALDADSVEDKVREHVALTHRHLNTDAAALALTRMLADLANGVALRDTIEHHGSSWIGRSLLDRLAAMKDRKILGQHFSTACYLSASFVGSLCLAWKYADDFSAGILANARCGGDNCHRGAVVGSLLGAANGVSEDWLRDLKSMERLRCDTLEPVFSD